MTTPVRAPIGGRFGLVPWAIALGLILTLAGPAGAQQPLQNAEFRSGTATGLTGLSRLSDQTSSMLGAVTQIADNAAAGLADDTGFRQLAAAGASAGAALTLSGAEIVNSVNRIPVEVNKGSLIRLNSPATMVFISNPEIADVQIKSPTLIYVFGKAPGETSLYALAGNDQVLFNGIVSVHHNLSRLAAAIARVLPGSAVKISSVEDSILLTGRVASAAAAEDARLVAERFIGANAKVINRVRITGPTQVNLRVRIAEVSRSVVKQIGFRWDLAVTGGDYLVGFSSGGNILQRTDNSIVGSFASGNLNLDAVLDALETEGLISLLAEPNLTALSGETASFLAGGEFPIPVPQQKDTITITFKKFGIGLAFTPTILSDGHINLKINPEVSQLTSAGAISIAGFSVPALTTRRASTTVELGSGQSFAIAGLLKSNVIRDLSKLPGLGDLPILGALFRSDKFQREETELVIIVTPYIVRPVSAPRMALPVDGLEMPNDIERILNGTSHRAHPFSDTAVPRDQKGRRLIGPAGFSLN